MTASSPRPAGSDTTGWLRKELTGALFPYMHADDRTESRDPALAARLASVEASRAADAVLALPALRDLLAERDTLAAQVRAVEGLATTWTRYPQSAEDRERNRYGAAMQDCGDALRRALGTPTTGGGE